VSWLAAPAPPAAAAAAAGSADAAAALYWRAVGAPAVALGYVCGVCLQ